MEPLNVNGMNAFGDLSSSSQRDNSSTSPTGPAGQKRQRAKQACEPCRLRKRRCDGNVPCNMCTQFEYKCYYEKHPRKRSKLVERNEVLHDHASAGSEEMGVARIKTESPGDSRGLSAEEAARVRSMEANSGQAFTRLLGLRLDPSSGPKLFTFGWNLGSSTYTVPLIPPITDFLAQDQMYGLAKLYFDNVHPLYGILDKAMVLEHLGLRWARPEACKVPDHIFANIAALGALFSDGSISSVLPQIVDSAKVALESTSTMQPPCLADVQSWVLRSLYLRATDHPHAVWMATCTTMHLIQAIALHIETTTSALFPAANQHLYDPEIRRRTFWVARMLNSWVSFEYGRLRVDLRVVTCQLPTPREGDFTTDYINLYILSCRLDPEHANQAGQWEDFLKQLEAYEAHHDGVALSKANLGLAGYRRLRLASPSLSSENITRIVNLGLGGLAAARRMAERGLPWWHVANVPFQVICVFLAMDVKESLAHITTAMRTLEDVVDRFSTIAMKEALKTARFLVRLSKKRKDEDSDVLGQSLKKDVVEGDPQPENMQPALRHGGVVGRPGSAVGAGPVAMHTPRMNGVGGGMTGLGMTETPRTSISNPDDWSMDILNNSDFDWNYFLTADMPAFNSFAPDGSM